MKPAPELWVAGDSILESAFCLKIKDFYFLTILRMLVWLKTLLCLDPQVLYFNWNAANAVKFKITFLENKTLLKQQYYIIVLLIPPDFGN